MLRRGAGLPAGDGVAGASSAVSEAVALQSLLCAADWLASAKITLQVGTGC